jgi:sarcosine oxidase subunit beta
VSETAAAVVVGAGIVGTSTAFNLAGLGVPGVVVLDRDRVAAHASRLSAGLVRTHYSNAPEARLALAGTRWFESWAERVGGDPGFHQTGLANLVDRQDHEKLRRNVAMLQGVGVETQLVGPEELVELEPEMRVAEDELAAYEPTRRSTARPADGRDDEQAGESEVKVLQFPRRRVAG